MTTLPRYATTVKSTQSSTNDPTTQSLQRSLEHLQGQISQIPAIHALTEQAEAIGAELQASVIAEIPAFSESRNPAVLALMAEHAEAHVQCITSMLIDTGMTDLTFVREHGMQRAEQHFPLKATLHAYRCGHKVLLRWNIPIPSADCLPTPIWNNSSCLQTWRETGYRRSSVRRLIDIHDNRIVVIFSDIHRKSGWTAASKELASRVSNQLEALGTTILVGVSNDVFVTARLPVAYREAQHALKLANVKQRLVLYSELGALQIMQYLAREEFSKILPAWAEALYGANQKSAGVLCATLKVYAAANMNAQSAAKVLGVHPNTIYARFARINEATGSDPRTFTGLSDLLVVCDCLDSNGESRR